MVHCITAKRRNCSINQSMKKSKDQSINQKHIYTVPQVTNKSRGARNDNYASCSWQAIVILVRI